MKPSATEPPGEPPGEPSSRPSVDTPSRSSRPARREFPTRIAILLGIPLILGVLFAAIDLSPDLAHMRVTMLSGPEQGNYAAIVQRLARSAESRDGSITGITTGGSVENLTRLAEASEDCQVHFALVQDGVPRPEGSELELIGRLRKSESMFIIGPDAARLERFAELRGATIGVGPVGSGTDHLARQVFESADFRPLGLGLQNHGLADQLALLDRGELDLAVFVLDEDADLIRHAVRERAMQLASFRHLDVVARQHSFVWHGRIGAGQYDPVRLLPESDKRVLRVDTLVVGNQCASRTQTIALLELLGAEFPGFVAHNRERGKSDSLPTSATTERFVQNDGPGLVERHIPWLVDIMAPENWLYVVTSVSLIFNLMTFWHRFRLWRIDANRDRNEQVVRKLLGARLTAEEIQELEPRPALCSTEAIAAIDRVIERMNHLRSKCQRQANSNLVPMGQEGAYRYQEDQMEDMLTALRSYRSRALAARDAS